MGLAWGLGYRLSEADLPRDVSHRQFVLWFLGLFISSWVGAKFLFALTQDQYAVVDLATASNFWLGGGFVFLGGFMGGLLFTTLVGVRWPALRPFRMQFTIIPLLWGHAIGRIGCFMAGCCYGKESDLIWAIHLHGKDRHPVQAYEALALGTLAWGLTRWRKNRLFLPLYLIGYGLVRWSLEWLRDDEIRGGWGFMSTSQWVSLVMLLLGLSLYFRNLYGSALKGER